ncbi:hypothetical protein FEM48_Zijuj12G0017800 [Ziziphus jujuba var. spinosa]|uniref:PGG domain-containing protein n=1 Tax=Ziziphus jujuba var. spinosa TaxID=714518 RepID=A0A978UAH5_ZIZJJ|nr:hypothetical protein FEM48_Zijuj12G0017800 [Ziziphus jujuba var. spinosa]
MMNMAKNTALHEAECNGHHGIVELLVEKDPSLASLRNDAGESPLFMALDRKFHTISLHILEKCHDHEGLFFQGRNGMTTMHAAVIRLSKRNKVMQILDKLCIKLAKRSTKFKKFCGRIKRSPFELILEEEVIPKKSVLNNKGMTTADIIESSIQYSTVDKREGHFKSLERRVIRETKTDHNQTADEQTKQLLKVNAPVKVIDEASSSGSTRAQENHQEKHDTGKPKSKQKPYEQYISTINLMVATIFASITFAAAMQMPGGYGSDGMANLRETVGFKIFLITDSVAFGCAAASMFIHFGVALFSKLLQVKYAHPIHCVMALTTIFITSSVLAFITGANVVYKHSSSHGGFQVGLPVYVGFKIFLITDSVAFGCAAASMFIHFGVALFSKLLQVKYAHPIHCVMALTTIFITSSVLAFITGANVVYKHSSSHGGFQVGLPVYVASLSFMIPILYFLLRSLIVAARRLPSVYVPCLVTLAALFITLTFAGTIK